jgi:hypothetical protein
MAINTFSSSPASPVSRGTGDGLEDGRWVTAPLSHGAGDSLDREADLRAIRGIDQLAVLVDEFGVARVQRWLSSLAVLSGYGGGR